MQAKEHWITNIRYPHLIIIATFVLIYSWFFRWAYLSPFNASYMLDLFDHSQWSLAGNIRSIGDDGLYQVVSYKLLTNPDPYALNAEAPPLGKYLYALGLKIWNSATILPLLLFPLAAFLFYNLSLRLLKVKKYALIALLVFLLDPLISSQTFLSMLDLPVLCTLLAHILLILKMQENTNTKKQIILAIGAGLTLGMGISTKFGITLLAVVIADIWLLIKSKKIQPILVMLFTTGATYIATTLPYIFLGNSLTEWVAVQKHVIKFYLESKAPRDPAVVFVSIFSPFYKGWWQSTWQITREWTILWPVSFAAFLIFIWRKPKTIKQNSFTDEWKYLSIMTTLLILINTAIPFWTRYLVIILPFLFIFLIKFTMENRIPKTIVFASLGIIAIQWILFIKPQPSELLTQIQTNIEKSTYQDLYMSLTSESQGQMSQDEFWRKNLMLNKELAVENIIATLSAQFIFPWQNTARANIAITYKTIIGEIPHNATVTLKRINNKWHLVWDWNIRLPNYSPEDTILTTIKYAKGGTAYAANGRPISEEKLWPVIYIDPQKVTDEVNLVYDIGDLTGIKRHEVQGAYAANNPYDWPARIGSLKPDYDPVILKKVSEHPAVSLKEEIHRVYDPEMVGRGDLPAILKAESEHLHSLISKKGGTIIHKKKDGQEKVLLQIEPQPGKDVTLSLDL